jgi:hypothetical protein
MRFSIRDLLWLTVVVAVVAAWLVARRQQQAEHKKYADEMAKLLREKQAAESQLFMRQGELDFLRQQMLDQRNRELAKKSLPLPQDLLHLPGRAANPFERPDLEHHSREQSSKE